jgi:hydroxymethylpyrimidine pyrophosphatase-like HAD family hydrolase
VYIGAKEHHKNNWMLSDEQYNFLENLIDSIDYKEKTGKHIEQRTGTANVSIVGRNADWDQRARYAEWESKNKGRDFIAEAYNNAFSDSVAQVAGETSIDIYKKGCDKSQAVKEQKGTTIYFGDHCYPGGNDYTASQEATVYHQISEGYKETWKILKNQYI